MEEAQEGDEWRVATALVQVRKVRKKGLGEEGTKEERDMSTVTSRAELEDLVTD